VTFLCIGSKIKQSRIVTVFAIYLFDTHDSYQMEKKMDISFYHKAQSIVVVLKNKSTVLYNSLTGDTP
jgi:hypothetical protein